MNPTKNYIGAGLLALAFFGAWGWAYPEYNNISELNIGIKERQDLYDSRSATIKKIQDINKEYQQKSADIAKISAVLPSKKSLAETLSAIDKLSSQNGLQLVSATVTGQPSNDPTNVYNLMPIELALSGNYLAFESFLQSTEKNLRLIDIIAINATSEGETSLLNFNVKANAYYLK